MFFDSFFEKYIKNKWLRLNVQAIFVGFIIGTILNGSFSVLRDTVTVKRVVITYLVSYMITMSITNTIALAHEIMSKSYKNKWSMPIIFYLSLFVGMFIGTELTFFFISIIYDVPYYFFTHIEDLKFNLFIAIVVGTVVYINGMQKEKYEMELKEKEYKLGRLNELKIKAELEALQSKINPHFLYNALNSITSLIHEQPALAEEMTIKLSKLFRYSLNTIEENFAKVEEEIEIVQLYLDIEKIRFQNKLIINLEVTQELLPKKIPRFLIQPLVENAIKHGINKLKTDGKIELKCWLEQNRIYISIHDNGPGFKEDYQAGYGLQSTFDKLTLFYDDKYEIQINNGTYKEILIIIPDNYEA